MQAEGHLRDSEIDELHLQALPASWGFTALLYAQGVKEPPDLNPFSLTIQRREAKAAIPRQVARTFLALATRMLIPEWVLAEVDVQAMRLAAE